MPDSFSLKRLGLSDFIALDLETTGLDSSKEQIIEIGAIKFVDGEPQDRFNSLVLPSITIPKFITDLTGISNEDVKDAPEIEDILPEFIEYCGNYPLVAHNSPFDMGFLRVWAAKIEASASSSTLKPESYFKNDVYDTALLSRIFFWWVTNHKLVTLADYFKLDPSDAHRASSDAERSGLLFLKIIDRMYDSSYQTLSSLAILFEGTNNSAGKIFKQLTELIAGSELKEGSELLPDHEHILGDNVIGKSMPVQFEAAPKLNLIDPKEVKAKFEVGGELSHDLEGYEERPQQENMAFAVADAFNSEKFLAVEAGTGVGKTLAYLVPSIMWAHENRAGGQRVVISTRTKNLQDQLFNKDIPFLYRSLKIPFKAVLLKGRNNYICLTRYHQLLSDSSNSMTASERINFAPMITWIKHTKTGDIEENHGFDRNRSFLLWNKLSADSGKCNRMRCKQYNGCYLGKVRESAGTADVLVVNHSLLLSDAVSNNQVLNEYQNLVVDEAHNLEKDAWQFLGEELSVWKIKNSLSALHDKENVSGGVADKFARIIPQIDAISNSDTLLSILDRIIAGSELAESKSVELFSELNKSPEWVPEIRSNYVSKIKYEAGSKFFNSVSGRINDLITTLYSIKESVKEFLEVARELSFNNKDADELSVEMLSAYESLGQMIRLSEELFDPSKEDQVYWVELPSKADSIDVRLHSVPLNMADTLNEVLYSGLRSAVFTSATLTTAGDFSHFLERTGVGRDEDERLVTLEVGSPFNYDEQSTIGVMNFLPPPNAETFNEDAIELISAIIEKIQLGGLILFTSYNMMNRFYEKLEPLYKKLGLSLLGQKKDGSRYSLQEKLKKDRGSLLLGTESFWEGIDVPGSALEMLVITKLPFAVPTEPIIMAIEDSLKKEGKNAFMNFSLPEAIIKFRQGFGRLIRSKTDKGIVLLLDNRLSQKQYGKSFLKSLPTSVKILNSKEEAVEWVQGIKL